MEYEDNPITKWFKVKNKNYVQSPKYFYYNGINTTFLLEKPKNYFKIGIVRWKEYDINLSICCSKDINKKFQDNNKEYLNLKNIANDNFCYSQIPIMKSNLQKCIRRSLSEQAVSSAITILCLKPSELLRRLPIIVLEDVTLNNKFLFLVWLMCAESKGLKINDDILNEIINIVNFLSRCKKADECLKLEGVNIKKYKLNDLTSEQRDILWSIQLRKSYGGMKGDLLMLNYFTDLWYNRFISCYKIINVKNDNSLNKRLLRKSDLILESIDFHCSNIINFIKNKYSHIEENKIKKSLWVFRSSYNIRKNNSKEKEDKLKIIWNEISGYVDFSSKIIINNNF